MSVPIITLTTDFGAGSAYVAQMKAVLLSALPEVRLVDVTHSVARHSVRHAEVALRNAAFLFPLGTVHMVVVDPGVGTARRPIAVQTRGLSFVGPDNGVLGLALAEPEMRVVVLDRPGFRREPTSTTFHGRDVFAPVAAELAAGVPLEIVGNPITDPHPSSLPRPTIKVDGLHGEVLLADDFGNLLTNIPAGQLHADDEISVAGRRTRRVRTYGEGASGELLALIGSDGCLEVAVREGSAARVLGADTGLEIVCTRKAGL